MDVYIGYGVGNFDEDRFLIDDFSVFIVERLHFNFVVVWCGDGAGLD